MKKQKRILAMILAVVMCFAVLAGCNPATPDPTNNPKPTGGNTPTGSNPAVEEPKKKWRFWK